MLRSRLQFGLRHLRSGFLAAITCEFWLAMGLLIFVGAASYANMRALVDSNDTRVRLHALDIQIQELLTTVTDAETGQRGYVLTGNESYLLPYRSALEAGDLDHDRLEEVVEYLPGQRAHVDALRGLIVNKFAELRETVQLRHDRGFEAALTVVQTNRGKNDMNEIRGSIAEIKQEIQQRLALCDQQVLVLSTRTKVFGILGNLIAAILFCSIILLLGRKVRESIRVEESTRALASSIETLRVQTLQQSDTAIALLGHQAHELAREVEASRIRALQHSEAEIEKLGQEGRDFDSFLENSRKGRLVESDREIELLQEKARDVARSVVSSRKTALSNSDQEIYSLGEKARVLAHAVEAAREQTLLSAATGMEKLEEQARILASPAESKHAMTDLQSELEIRKLNQKLEQRAVERSGELRAANKELESLTYTISHDLRSPLRAIDGFSRILLEEFATPLPDRGKAYLKLVRDSANQMGRLVDDLLAFSRLGRLELAAQRIDPNALVRLCLTELQKAQEGRQLDIAIGQMPFCRGDPILVKQVWMNLLSNALKYSSKRNAARIEIGCRTEPRPSNNGLASHLSGSGEELVYFVKDNGAGFDMKYAHKLFGVFQRLHAADEYEGTGVGLAIVQRIVHRHGGRVWADARLDGGATFSFTLEHGANDDREKY